MPFYSLKSRLEEIEKKLSDRETQEVKNNVITQRLFDKLDALDGHLKEHTQRESEESKIHAAKLNDLADSIESIKRDLVTIPKDTEIKINQAQSLLREHVSENYATQNDLNESLGSLRNQAKMIWSTLVAVEAALGWFFDKY